MSIPKLRFKDFNGDWTLSELDEHIHESRASSKIQDEYEVLTSSRRGLIRQADYFENSRLTDRENIGFNIIEPDQITYRSRSDDGFFFFNLNGLGITGIISTYYPVFTMKKGNNWFLNELLNYHKYKYIQYAVGTSQLVLSLNQLRKIKFNIPCLDEQTKIASFLSAVDEKISQLTRKHELLSQYKQGMMQKLFSQQIRFKADDGSEFGEWEDAKLGSICQNFQSGKSITSAEISEDGDYPVYGGNGLRGYTNTFNHEGKYALIGRQGALCGNVVLVEGKNFVSEHAIAVQTKEKHSTDWLFRWLDYMQLNRFSESSAQAGLAVNKLVKFDIQTPCLEEQTKIANFLSAIDQKIEVVAQQIEQAKIWKKGLLQQMFV